MEGVVEMLEVERQRIAVTLLSISLVQMLSANVAVRSKNGRNSDIIP